MDTLEMKLNDLIMSEINRTNDLDGNARTEAVDNVCKLYRMRIEDTKAQSDAACAKAEKENQAYANAEEAEARVKDRRLRIGMYAVDTAVVLATFFTGLNFEKTNCITSSFVKNVIRKIGFKK